MTDRLKERLADFTYVEDYGDYDAMVHPDICDEALDRITQLEAALEQIAALKQDPIGETGFLVGPAALFSQAQHIARAALQGDRKP